MMAWWRLMVMDTFSPKVNLCPSWMCLMANTLGIPGESCPTETRTSSLDLTWDSQKKKKTGKDWQVWSFETMEATGGVVVFEICCFQDDIIFMKYHPFAGFIASCWSQVRNAFIGFCSAAVSDTCAVAQWILSASWRRRHQTRWWGETST